ncbi:carboxypeptidase-like regulatory domain-containing protein [Ekhidna sp.]|uniref:carboxypeptidase-like regulatory domain-containing protein n=1 Tax=Ekhidna sp. TaxID=2608089 RepID=UPI003C79C9F3
MPFKLITLLFVLTHSIVAFSQESKKYYYLINHDSSESQLVLKGRILDQDHQGIPFVNIGIRGTLHGTAADDEGYFILKLPQNLENEMVTISCVGFQSLTLPVTELQRKYQFVLDDDISQLMDIEIMSERITARDVIKEVIKRIPENYLQEPYTQFKHFKIKLKGRDSDFVLYEKISEEYDEDGYKSTPMYGLGKIESFGIIHQARIGRMDSTGKASEFKNVSTDIPTHTAWADAVNIRFNNFLSRSKQSKYDFQFNERGINSPDTIYIDFKIDNPNHRNTTALNPLKFSGSMLIDAKTYAVLEIHSLATLDKEKMQRSKTYKSYVNNELVWWEREIVKYKKIDGQYYFSSFQRLSNWDLDSNGYVEVIGLGIKKGIREGESNKRSLTEYELEKWNALISSTQ